MTGKEDTKNNLIDESEESSKDQKEEIPEKGSEPSLAESDMVETEVDGERKDEQEPDLSKEPIDESDVEKA